MSDINRKQFVSQQCVSFFKMVIKDRGFQPVAALGGHQHLLRGGRETVNSEA